MDVTVMEKTYEGPMGRKKTQKNSGALRCVTGKAPSAPPVALPPASHTEPLSPTEPMTGIAGGERGGEG
ncbi:hypothetical protein E2C01_065473 [Portunus trituberculatus]|uniref:Uncharacterized protein n=1 Tax=Portunus trituberculatus TaxID=210409 RepID=A0A5B7HEN9_PORTR|nr:hypothetical protein [Portunus trituberculatus]